MGVIKIPQSRSEIPKNIANKVLFDSDFTCCICRTPGLPIQIHHIDGNPNNHDYDNLAVLCFHDHDRTLMYGGFGRKMNSELIKMYRNDWINIVNDKRYNLIKNSNIKKEIQSSNKLTKTIKIEDLQLFFKNNLNRIDSYYERKEWNLIAI